MAKAVLVMDMPERCDMCDLCYTLPFGNKVCYIEFKGVTGQKRPDCCPLWELPEKKETNYYMNNKEKGIVEGWNACLDAAQSQ